VRQELVALIVPSVLLDEFRRNPGRIATESARSLSTHFRLVKDAVGKSGGDKRRLRVVLAHLDDVNHKIPIVGGGATATLDRIETLLIAASIVEPSDSVKLRAAQHAIQKRAPFHRGKNAMADAILFETFAACLNSTNASGVRFAFVTHNTSDFSVSNGNRKGVERRYGKKEFGAVGRFRVGGMVNGKQAMT
jgi:phosphoglycolate phosphatase-like HAD superfamily hydrolase